MLLSICRCSLNKISPHSRVWCSLKKITTGTFLNSSFNIHSQIISNIHTSPPFTKAVHTTKGWKKAVLAGTKKIEKPKQSEAPVSSEEGKDAIHHSVLMSELQKCDTFSSQIDTFCSVISITPEEVKKRKAFLSSLDEVLKIYFHNFKTNLFGSTMNGLGFHGCDADVCLRTNLENKEVILLKEVPKLESVLKGDISQEILSRMNPHYLLRFVRRILKQHCSDIQLPILFIKARCPILRFYNSKYEVFCDFSCETGMSVRNTRLLNFLSHLDSRFAPVTKVIRYWGKYGGFVGDIEMYNSYSFSLLVAYFFQNTQPPIFPSIEEIFHKSKYIQEGDINDENLIIEDLKCFTSSPNTKSSEELLREFFFYFLCYDFSRIIMPYTNTSVPKSSFAVKCNSEDVFEFGTINVQDPFRPAFNATCGANFKSAMRFLNGLVVACKSYSESPRLLHEEIWGLSTLFEKPLSESQISNQWQEDLCHKIELPSRPNAAEKLKQILEYGLLFQCQEFKVGCSTDSSKIIVKLRCKAYHNTWQGRDLFRLKYAETAIQTPLEAEHLISDDLLQSKGDRAKTLLCEFVCECIDKVKGDKLEFILNFKVSKYPPIVAIFLKEFIKGLFQKM